MGCQVQGLFCDLDGEFPNHHPDPSRPENVEDLIKSVAKNNSDIPPSIDLYISVIFSIIFNIIAY